jgi:serine/threonine protein kinase
MGKYKVIEPIITHPRNFGEVYRGIWQGTTEVALKKLKNREGAQEFKHEAEMLQSISHPYVVQFYGKTLMIH